VLQLVATVEKALVVVVVGIVGLAVAVVAVVNYHNRVKKK
jgi:hypothetical protein